MDPTILHIDMNSCYASIECLHNPSIRHLPVAVGGDAEARHGIILAKNDLAKKAGVKTGEVLWQAKLKCPELVILKPRYELYLRFSRMAREIYSEYSDRIEPFGLDEAWMLVSGAVNSRDGYEVADEIRKRIKFELGITVSIGVSFNKPYAKLGSDYKKPDAVTVFSRENYKELVYPLPMEDLLYVGPATKKKLWSRGLRTIGDIVSLGPDVLRGWFGKIGEILYIFAAGEDRTPVAHVGEEAVIKSIGNSNTAPRDLTCVEDANIMLYVLAESVAERMRADGFYARTVQLHLRDTDLFGFDRQCKLPHASCLASDLHDAAMRLLRENYTFVKPLRSIGVRACDLTTQDETYQMSLFEDPTARDKRLAIERTMDDIRRRFGHFAISRGVTMTDSSLHAINPVDDNTIHPVGYFR